MDKRISSLVEEFNTLTGLSNIPNEEKFKATTKKRSANEESKTTKKKKAETNDEPEENVSIEEIVKSAHAKGTLSKLTIPSLKEYLAHVGVKPKKLRKADLLEQVEELLSQ
ncbi:hypothetical protein ROZALSC1DRAFT_28486 [Rozella allomycis CSF55]|uniref:Uncharacterized protein n=1 Tax=Rozella allomycis (strain CSF55) TaxID=988480 RepID=A0A4P9YLB9_ROZAC|nr:hypothetical protein ROZALSC1DRAFT_28486 [Rozella allomycis CSF55]